MTERQTFPFSEGFFKSDTCPNYAHTHKLTHNSQQTKLARAEERVAAAETYFVFSPFRQRETAKRPQVKIHLKKYRITVVF